MSNSLEHVHSYWSVMNSVESYGIFTLSPTGIVETWNEGARIVQGYTAEETIGKPFGPLYEAETHKKGGYFDDILKSTLDHGFFEEEGWRERKNGAYYWASLVITPIYDKEGKMLLFTAISRDVTSKKMAAEISEITETKHKNTVLSTSNIAWIRGSDGQFLSPHLQWENYTGQLWPSYKGFGWLEMHPVAHRDKIKSFWENLQHLDWSPFRHNFQILHKPAFNRSLILRTLLWSSLHNEYRHVILSVVPEFQPNGQLFQWIGNEKDVHRIRATEEQFRSVVAQQQLILSSCRLGVFELSFTNKTIRIDDFIAHLFAIDMTTFGNDLSELIARIHPSDRLRLINSFDQAKVSGEPFHEEFQVVWPSGVTRFLVWQGKVQYDSTNLASSIIGTGWDVTETKELLAKQARILAIEKQQKDHAEFVDSICHELRNPLNGIIAHLDDLKQAMQLLNTITVSTKVGVTDVPINTVVQIQSCLQSGVDVIEECSQHQCSVIDQMLEISTLETGNATVSRDVFSVEMEIEFVVAMLRPLMKRKNLKPLFRFPPQAMSVISDKTRFKQIVMNLVTIAINNSPESSDVRLCLTLVQCTETNVSFQIRITYEGIGYTAQDIANLFDRYMPIINHESTEYESGGLGLAISKRLIQLLEGTLHIEAVTASGAGTAFILEFCMKRGEVTCPPMSSPLLSNSSQMVHIYENGTDSRKINCTDQLADTINDTHNKHRILVVDDNAVNRKVLSRHLNKFGYTTFEAENGEEAVQLCDSISPDLIFMDLQMPRLDGFQATILIRSAAKHSDVPIYAVSGYGRDEYKSKAIQAGMQGYILKPINRQDIFQILQNHFHKQAT